MRTAKQINTCKAKSVLCARRLSDSWENFMNSTINIVCCQDCSVLPKINLHYAGLPEIIGVNIYFSQYFYRYMEILGCQ